MQNEEMNFKAVALTVFLCVVFGANTVAIKLCLTGLGPFTAAGIRFSIAALAIYLWARYKKSVLTLSIRQSRQMAVLAAIFVTQLSCFYIGLGKTSASHGALISNVLPFVVLILAHFFIPGDTISLRKGIGITLGFAGVLFLFFDEQDLSGDFKTGDMIVLTAVILWSSSAVYAKRIISGYNVIQITLYPIVFGTPFFFMGGFLWDKQMIGVIDTTVAASLFYQAIISAAFGFMAWNSLLQRFGATALHSFVFIMPLSGVLSGVLLLDESITPHLAASVILIVAGVLVVNLKKTGT